MKGLLLKDFYMMKKYCKAYLLLVLVFVILSFIDNQNLFLIFYPCIFTGMLPVTLLGYDERSKWHTYSNTLPYSKAQLVSAKYLIGLSTQSVLFICVAVVQAIKMKINGTLHLEEYLVLLTMLISLSYFAPAISLPFMFRFGVEKGRIMYSIMTGVMCGISVLVGFWYSDKLQAGTAFSGIPFIFCAMSIVLYALSWYLSILFYQKRNIG